MKKLLILSSLLFFTGLSAEQEEGTNLAYQDKKSRMENESCVQECPRPCEKCCPKPKPPICCECYVPSYYDLQCNQGAFFYGDFLYWYAKEDNLSPCLTVQGNSSAISSAGGSVVALVAAPVKANHLNTKWDPGFRVGVGYNFDHDGWDIEANYTWYQNKKHHVFSVPGFGSTSFPSNPSNGQLAFVDPWVNPDILVDSGTFNTTFLFDTVNTSWKLTFNQIDLELGRKYWLGKYTAMRAYAGVRGAWFTTRFNNASSQNANFSSLFTFNKFSDNFKDRIWGVGLLGGIQPEWHFCRNFLLFSNLDAALLWGKIRVRKNEDYTSFAASGAQNINYHNTFTSSFYKMDAVLDLSIGLRWEETWCYRIRTAVDLGWDHHIWFDVNDRFKFTSPSSSFTSTPSELVSLVFVGYEELQGNLMMGGLVVRFRADF